MKDNNGTKTLPKGTVYKDVVIIGNGPSGISLSFMLSGHWPYWNPEKTQKLTDELLRARLNHADRSKSLVEHDLYALADGLEGRTTNPVSLLLDNLQHPNADLGMELPSMLDYRYHPEKEIDHIVLGRGPAGGSWHRMDPNLRTLSLSAWMSLPGSDFNEWDRTHPPTLTSSSLNELHNKPTGDIVSSVGDGGGGGGDGLCEKCAELRAKNSAPTANLLLFNNNESELGALCCRCSSSTTLGVPRRNLSLRRQMSKEVEKRALVSRVAEYYESYVHEMGLEKYFLNNSVVTSVLPVAPQEKEEIRNARWLVAGFNRLTNKPFAYACRHLVLANGASDMANRLGVKGEGLSMPWLKYELPQLETALAQLRRSERLKMKPVMIVGAGLSAADAVTMCRASEIPVVHVYRNKTVGMDKQSLPASVYPEYHEVHRMMRDGRHHDLYTPLPEHAISDLYPIPTKSGGHLVTVKHLRTDESHEIEISYCAILIGSRPDLRFLNNIDVGSIDNFTPEIETPVFSLTKKLLWLKNVCAKSLNLCDGRRNENRRVCGHRKRCAKGKSCECSAGMRIRSIGLGEDPKKPIDCKNNPIAVDKYSYEVLRIQNGLFAIGPLAGDNFVRFIPGGALAITAALHKEQKEAAADEG